MERIGLAASKIAKGNFFLYNCFVILLSFLFSLLVFFIAGSSIVLALIIISYIVKGLMPLEFEKNWQMIIRVCMITLTVLVGIFNFYAILRNIQTPSMRIKKHK